MDVVLSPPNVTLNIPSLPVTVLDIYGGGGLLAMLSTAIWSLQPLHTSSRWILDAGNKRVKLRCVNWAGHMEAGIPEGLQHQPVDAIAQIVADSGFTCVRLTFSIDMALDQEQKVADSFATLASRTGADAASVAELWSRVKDQNPWIADASVSQAFGRVIDALGGRGLRVILDNHVSRASWCCNLSDGNGWWDAAPGYNDANSRFFNTTAWAQGLAAMARFSGSHPAVAGIGLRNEIREVPVVQPRDAWYTYIALGAQTVHAANPDLLIVMGGTLSSTDASFLRTRPLDRAPFGADKVVWEWHHYTFSPNWIASFKSCSIWSSVTVGGTTGFLLQQGKAYTGPLWLSEFGFGMTGGPPERSGIGSQEDYDYLTCLVKYMAGNDGDWALWALQGNYYVRDGVVDRDEGWGLLNGDWTAWRNPAVKDVLAPLFQVTQGP
ncbi:glycoside hydrolase family 5 protein [Trematosphaeria pertusa]|uniref:Glycoside hydrolase family 5 protein n=1 Tax=Trematosphaeria pertusa TaxID=390896 RepID=A0A6A6IJW7_9PLEO|nr:glycoside hydrolase family 5 protein [Trematosphaeria pertusa]KAF2250666.1 glycoside hydrolase family 5 protein [Trematosphaeria pertusa]